MTLREALRLLLLITAVFGMFAPRGNADAQSLEATQSQSSGVRIGIEGHYRVGRWTGVRFGGNQRVDSIETRDGDGVQVQYDQPRPIDLDRWGYVIPGSEAAPLVLRSDGAVVATTRLPTEGSPSRGDAMIPLKMRWIVAIGDPLEVESIGANEILERDAQIAVSIPKQPGGFPDSALGYDGVDLILIGGSSSDLLRGLSEPQRRAISDWIIAGGRVLLTLGESAPELVQAAPWLVSLLPIAEIVTTEIDPSALESYTSTQTPLEPFVGAKLPKDKGRMLIMGRTSRRVSTPLAVDYNVGFGRVTVVAADLDNDAFARWPERLDLITRLTGTILIPEPPQEQRRQRSRSTAYDDLAGQLRSALDQFGIKRQFGFSLVSLILMALIAAIGPLDFLLINRVLGRPLLGWLTFPIVAIGLSIVLAYQSKPVATAGTSTSGTSDVPLHYNRIEIFDFDANHGIGRGFATNYLYVHGAARFDITVEETESLSAVSKTMDEMVTVPFGYAGESFGGIQIAIEDSRLPIYQVEFDIDGSGDGAETRTSMKGLPLASRSSKSIATYCRFEPKFASDVVMDSRPGSELLQGEFTNPLPIDVLDGMLVYRNWAYLLPTRFPAGAAIARVDTLRQKNFRWRLSRQEALGSSTETEAWDPTDNDSPHRIAEMLMFHDAVGGTRYTGLRHDPLSFLDLSHVLADDRCLLVGKVDENLTRISATDRGNDKDTSGTTLTLVRVALPVRKAGRYRSLSD